MARWLRLNIRDGALAGEMSKPLLLAAFANAPYYGDGMLVAPRARMDDGMLDLCLINPLNSLKLVSLFPSVYFGRHLAIEEVEYSQAERVAVESFEPVRFNGERGTAARLQGRFGMKGGRSEEMSSLQPRSRDTKRGRHVKAKK